MKDENSEICHLLGFIRYINDIPDSKNNIKIKRELNMQEDNKNEQKQYFVTDHSEDGLGVPQLVYYGTEPDFLYLVHEDFQSLERENENPLGIFGRNFCQINLNEYPKINIVKIDDLEDLFTKYHDTNAQILIDALDFHTYDQSDIEMVSAYVVEELIPYLSDPDSHECRLNDLKNHFENNVEDMKFDTENDLEQSMIKSFNIVNDFETKVLDHFNADIKEFYGENFINLREELKKDYVSNLLQTKTKKLKM